RGNSDSQHTQRQNKNLKLYYSDNENDLGNIEDYDIFLTELQKVFKNCYSILKKKGYMVVIIQNFRNSDGTYVTLAWDLVKKIEGCGFSFEGEQLWCQEDKKLGIWGYPSKFISNIHHHYCLIFRKNA
ncbi:DNA methylase, partial [bacterium]|nr:DNA methylase [bacterium]